ncbi:MAG: mercuric reductase [Planctomycetes bacterium]|nr:mercuric reductase [Planctomycetota bacterium]
MEIPPFDEHNQTLVDHAHPADWTNPTPARRYNLVAIGGGTAGIISALGTAGLGGKAALVERHLLGGDCLNYGCVPSKALIRAARIAHQVSIADQFGVTVPAGTQVEFAAVMERLRRLRAQISHHDSAQRFTGLGCDVFLGEATFSGPDTLEVDGQTLRFSRAVIATGARAFVPPIPGLDEVDYLTNETIFSLTELPRRLVVIGAGPIGSEMAQSFRRFGSEVHLIDRAERILSREDPAASAIVQAQFEKEGIHLHLGWNTASVEATGDSKAVVLERGDERKKIIADQMLIAVGRKANVEGLGLEAAGVEYTPRGVTVDDRLQTTNSKIYAAGDVCSKYQFTHAADAMARICIQNALFLGRKKASGLVIPRATYTDPEIAHVGLTPHDAAEQGIEIDSYREQLKEVDRAILDSQDEGFAVVHTLRGSGRVVGATIVGAHAGEMIGEITLLMTAKKLTLGTLAATIHCYPTQVEVLKRIADAYSRTKLTPRIAGAMKKWLAWRR